MQRQPDLARRQAPASASEPASTSAPAPAQAPAQAPAPRRAPQAPGQPQPQQPERAPRPERSPRPDRPGRPGRPDRPEQPGKTRPSLPAPTSLPVQPSASPVPDPGAGQGQPPLAPLERTLAPATPASATAVPPRPSMPPPSRPASVAEIEPHAKNVGEQLGAPVGAQETILPNGEATTVVVPKDSTSSTLRPVAAAIAPAFALLLIVGCLVLLHVRRFFHPADDQKKAAAAKKRAAAAAAKKRKGGPPSPRAPRANRSPVPLLHNRSTDADAASPANLGNHNSPLAHQRHAAMQPSQPAVPLTHMHANLISYATPPVHSPSPQRQLLQSPPLAQQLPQQQLPQQQQLHQQQQHIAATAAAAGNNINSASNLIPPRSASHNSPLVNMASFPIFAQSPRHTNTPEPSHGGMNSPSSARPRSPPPPKIVETAMPPPPFMPAVPNIFVQPASTATHSITTSSNSALASTTFGAATASAATTTVMAAGPAQAGGRTREGSEDFDPESSVFSIAAYMPETAASEQQQQTPFSQQEQQQQQQQPSVHRPIPIRPSPQPALATAPTPAPTPAAPRPFQSSPTDSIPEYSEWLESVHGSTVASGHEPEADYGVPYNNVRTAGAIRTSRRMSNNRGSRRLSHVGHTSGGYGPGGGTQTAFANMANLGPAHGQRRRSSVRTSITSSQMQKMYEQQMFQVRMQRQQQQQQQQLELQQQRQYNEMMEARMREQQQAAIKALVSSQYATPSGTIFGSMPASKATWKLGGLKYLTRDEARRQRAQRKADEQLSRYQANHMQQRESLASRISSAVRGRRDHTGVASGNHTGSFFNQRRRSSRKSTLSSVTGNGKSVTGEQSVGVTSSVYDTFNVW
ncbi:hypothetical protein BC831DRAFT_462745 [Entophlyctis helioformis]|nr:hypothetical protein BC831DRAFT_462745 [Entophlyctis helioformis]